MAWTLVKETFKQQWQDNISGKRGVRIFYAVSDTKILDNDDVLLADDGTTAIPALTTAWSVTQSGVTVTDRRVKEIDNGKLLFNVEVEYSTPTGTGTSGSDDPDPTARPWDISTGTFKEERNIDKTLISTVGFTGADINLGDDVSIVNAASEPLEVRGFTRNTILNLSKNYTSIASIGGSISDIEDLKAYEGTLNNSAVTIAGIVDSEKWHFLIDEVNVANARENEIDFVRVTYRIIHNRDTHIEVLLNAGFSKLVDDGGTKKRVIIKDEKKQPKKTASLLDINGAPVDATDPSIAVATGTYISAGINYQLDHNDLNLPTTFN